jgi:hypothetical protein
MPFIYMHTNLVWVYFCKLFYMHTSRAKVYPPTELEHGLRPNSQISQYIIPTKVSAIQPRYDILYIYKSCPVDRQ